MLTYFVIFFFSASPCIQTKSSITDPVLVTIANFTLNDEAGRVEKLDGIETKFYCLKKYEVIASVSVFAIEVLKGKFEVFSFILILPYSEVTEFLPRHSICESKVQRLLKEYLILPLRDIVSSVCTEMYLMTIPMHWSQQYNCPKRVNTSLDSEYYEQFAIYVCTLI